ncbi:MULTISPECIES: hypothetical protein [Pyrobaculum]|uniref:Uncharacterized protein n=2 Tax=Pyrobaculum arsenaticum TaxID=121277 RepID=A4WJR9_PYRAR|nr:hypothetical protein [Pyrobaculum arsenaticum]ABP50636.1 conserved hypothetical protein [Pyrobaculum arsenaticum DSM 13514]MCY0889564.1 hypothetical protein [Pyrobaculum arsenaticum]NYR14432.1 hypothetical protein [Pyrobaculum arsenaticum]
MRIILDIVISVLALYVAYKVFMAWRSLSDMRLSLYSFGMAMLAASLIAEAVVDMYLSNLLGEAPMRAVRRMEAALRLTIQILSLAALVPVAIAVTPTAAYAVLPIGLILAPLNAVLSFYIAGVTFVKSLDRGSPPYISLAFFFYGLSTTAPILSLFDLLARLLTAVFLALSVYHAQATAK